MRRKRTNSKYFPIKIEDFKKDLKRYFNNIPELSFKDINNHNQKIVVVFLNYLIEKPYLYNNIIKKIQETEQQWDNESLLNDLTMENGEEHVDVSEIGNQLSNGSIAIYIENEKNCVTLPLYKEENRSPDRAETESLIYGPKLAFTESLYTNLNIVQNRISNPNLKIEQFTIGNTVPTEVRLVYLDSIANDDDINEMRKRLKELEADDIVESSMLTQLIEDNTYSIFPQFISTELPDRFSYSINEGRIGLLVDKSPAGIIAPTTFFSFFESTEDLYKKWSMASFIRIMRLVATFISLVATPFYVAALTFHYEIVPTELLVQLGDSRSRVPFPPLLEALIMELFIEFIREAGARLPSKVGQTMGIVGGIVIGQAIVEAGFTSNILIIIVALSALGSFTAPSYLMGSIIRIIRFPIIVISGIWGILGIMFSFAFIIIHLLKQRSLNRPYLAPFYPLQVKDFDDSFFRFPFKQSNKRPLSNMPKIIKRFEEPKKSKIRKKLNDIDEQVST